MKKIFLVLICFILASCQFKLQENSLDSQIQDIIYQSEKQKIISADNNKQFYSYYTEPSVGRIKTSQLSTLFKINQKEFVMNLNVINIVNEQDIQTMPANDHKLFSLSGKYTDGDNEKQNYIVDVYQFDQVYYLKLTTKYVNFSAKGTKAYILSCVDEMMKIAKSIEIYKENILAAYTDEVNITSSKEQIKLFEVMIPESGRVEELLNGINSDDVDLLNEINTVDE